MFWRDESEEAFWGGIGNKIRLHFPKGITNLNNAANGPPLSIKAEVKRDGIKNIPENPRKGNEQDPPIDGKGNSVLVKISRQVAAYIFSSKGEMIIIAECVKIEAVSTQERNVLCQGVNLVKIEAEHKDTIGKLMPLG